MASKKKLRKKLRKEQGNTAAARRRADLAEEQWDQYDDFQRWARKHAPATLKRYGSERYGDDVLPRYRPQTMDEIMKFHYAPALRASMAESTVLFNVMQGTPPGGTD